MLPFAYIRIESAGEPDMSKSGYGVTSMSVSLLEVLNSAGYDIETSRDDANWLLSVQSEFDDQLS